MAPEAESCEHGLLLSLRVGNRPDDAGDEAVECLDADRHERCRFEHSDDLAGGRRGFGPRCAARTGPDLQDAVRGAHVQERHGPGISLPVSMAEAPAPTPRPARAVPGDA